MSTKILSLVILVLLAGVAGAQDQGPDHFGLYFDDPPDGCYQMWCIDGTPGAATAYMVIAGPTAASVGGLEIAFALGEGDGAIVGTFFVVDAVDADDTPEGVSAVFSEPVPPTGDCNMVTLGEFEFFGFGYPTEIYAGPNDPATIPGYPSYLDGEDPANVIPLGFYWGEEAVGEDGWLLPWYPLAVYNGECVYPADSPSWSEIKDRYR
jgi:hypothetical protein